MEEQEPITITTDEVPHVMNRAERRSQVKLYALLLRESNKQQPVVNATIIPKNKRRPKGRGNRRLNRA